LRQKREKKIGALAGEGNELLREITKRQKISLQGGGQRDRGRESAKRILLKEKGGGATGREWTDK